MDKNMNIVSSSPFSEFALRAKNLNNNNNNNFNSKCIKSRPSRPLPTPTAQPTHPPLKKVSSGSAAFRNLVLKQQQIQKQQQQDEQNVLEKESTPLANGNNNDHAKMAKVVTTARGTQKATQKLLAGKNIREKLKGQIRKIAQERLTMKQVFKRYVESSTLHGFRYVCSDTFFIRRFIWAILMILGAIYFIVKLRHGIEEYFDFPFSTLSTVQYVETLQFPAISFCSVNQFKSSSLKSSKLYPFFKNKRLPLQRNWTDPIIDLPGDEFAKTMREVTFGVDDLFMSCEYIAADSAHPLKQIRNCSKANFTTYFSETGQLCFTLNSGKPGHEMMEITMEGLNNAFEVLFDLKNFESIMENDYSGMQVIVHDQIDPPIFKSGFFLPAGTKTYAKLSKTETENLPPPYRTRCGETELKYYDTYNQNACLLEKLTDYVGRKCGCRELYMPDNGMPFCSIRETILCAFRAKETFDRFSHRTKCPIECEKVTYTTALSSTPFIQNARIGIEPRLIKQKIEVKNYSHHLPLMKMYQNMSSRDLENYIEENIVVCIFFFGDMSKKVDVQEATFDFYQFLGDMGGEIGLMLGASLLTFFEFIDLFGFLGYHQLLRLYKEKKEKYRHSMMIKRQSLLFSRDGIVNISK